MTRRIATLVLTLAGATLVGVPSVAKGPETFPLSQIRPGMRGYGLTVFQGTNPERFEFEVIGVVKNMMPKMDIILVRSEDPKVQLSGMAQGMSGSPMFIDGKLACAFAYSWSFNKVAMGGCTPIEYMIREAKAVQQQKQQPQPAPAARAEWD